MIRFSASLVVVGVGLLIAGGVTSKLVLIYIAIGVSALALLFLLLGAILHWAELFGREPEGIVGGRTAHEGHADEVGATPEPATAVTSRPGPDELNSSLGRGAASEPDRWEAQPAGAGSAGAAVGTSGAVGAGSAAGAGGTTGQPPRGFAGYEQFTKQTERRRTEPSQPAQPSPSKPSEPRQPFVDPQPTRMDWAAGLREAENQERERQGLSPIKPQPTGRPAGPAPRPPDRPRPDRGQPSKPFVDPQPTRMDWAAGLREAEKRDPERQAQDRSAEPETRRPSGAPQSIPEPSRAEATRAERIQQPADATRAEKVIKPAVTEQYDQAEAKADAKKDQRTAASAAAPESAGKEKAESESAKGDGATAVAGAGPAKAGEKSTPATVQADDAGGDAGPLDAVPSDQDVTVVPGVPRYHRSECILIRFMGDNDLQRMRVEQAREAGCTPCRACQPDGEED